MLSLLPVAYHDKREKLWHYLSYLAKCCSIDTAVKFMVWYGHPKQFAKLLGLPSHVIKAIEGSLCSGDFNTTDIGSKYTKLMKSAFEEFVHQKMKNNKNVPFTKYTFMGEEFCANWADYNYEEYLDMFNIKKTESIFGGSYIERNSNPQCNYGDDNGEAILAKFKDLYFNKIQGRLYPTLYDWYLQTYWYSGLKFDDTKVFWWGDIPPGHRSPFLTKFDKDDNIVWEGPRFLQRYFVEIKVFGEIQVVCKRDTRAFWLKVCCKPQDKYETMKFYSTLMGLYYDNMGTNASVHRFLDDIQASFHKQFPTAHARLKYLIENKDYSSCADALTRLKRLGYNTPSLLLTTPTATQLLSHFIVPMIKVDGKMVKNKACYENWCTARDGPKTSISTYRFSDINYSSFV